MVMRTLTFVLIVLAAWMLPMTIYAMLTKRAEVTQPVIYVPVETQLIIS
jgi:hypothetical protein